MYDMRAIMDIFAGNHVIMVLNILLYVSVFIASCLLVRFWKYRSRMEEIKEVFYNKVVRGDINRESDMEYLKSTVGAIQKKSLYERTNNILYFSGVRLKFYWLTPTVFFITLFFITLAAGLLAFRNCTNFVLSTFVTCIPVFMIYLFLQIMMTVNNKQVENELMSFINMIDNFSTSTDDIIYILERSSHYLGNVLRLAIQSCVSYARLSGNVSRALMRLSEQIEHTQFRRFIIALELASRSSCDYKQVVDDFRERTNENLSAIKKLDAVYSNCRAEVFTILFVGAFVIYMSLDLVGEMGGFFQVVNAHIFGQIIFVFLALIYISSCWYIIFRLNNKFK